MTFNKINLRAFKIALSLLRLGFVRYKLKNKAFGVFKIKIRYERGYERYTELQG